MRRTLSCFEYVSAVENHLFEYQVAVEICRRFAVRLWSGGKRFSSTRQQEQAFNLTSWQVLLTSARVDGEICQVFPRRRVSLLTSWHARFSKTRLVEEKFGIFLRPHEQIIKLVKENVSRWKRVHVGEVLQTGLPTRILSEFGAQVCR